jgi:hypothetical protein
MKDISIWMLDYKYDIWCRIRKYYMWFECSWIIGGAMYIPQHTYTESAVAFFMCLTTKGVHDLVKKNNNRLAGYERNFELNDKKID